jgi:hypothetical protein
VRARCWQYVIGGFAVLMLVATRSAVYVLRATDDRRTPRAHARAPIIGDDATTWPRGISEYL